MSEHIDVIVLTVDRANLKPLRGLIGTKHTGIVVDNSDVAPRMADYPSDWDHIIQGSRDWNYSQSLNRALQHHTPGRRVLFISDDARPRWNAIREMLAHDDPIVSTINISSDGTVNHAGGTFTNGGSPIHVGRGWRIGDIPDECEHHAWVTWACTLVSDEVIQAVGDFDDKFFWSHEEVDYTLRARELGFGPPRVCRHAIIDHDEHGVSDTPRQLRQNVDRYQAKWITSGRLERMWQPQAN